MIAEGFVLGQCKDGFILNGFAYYGGEGHWTDEDNARLYQTRGQMREGLREARKEVEAGIEVHAFGVYYEQ